MDIWTAFTIGILGSLHCVGMCGPIALALPFQESSKLKTFGNALLYNVGRTMSYTLIGIIPGLLGLGFFISGYQSGLSFVVGFLLLIAGLFATGLSKQVLKIPLYDRFQKWLQGQFNKQMKQNSRQLFLNIGLLNGLLPCGMVYVAVAGAVTQESIWGAMLYMLFFGLGTFPLMLLVSLSGNWISIKFRQQLRRLYPVFLIGFGLLFILRAWQIELPSDVNFWFLSGPRPMCH